MRIFCDYCGNQFETNDNNTCPSCGAAYEGDTEIKNAALMKAREAEMRVIKTVKQADALSA